MDKADILGYIILWSILLASGCICVPLMWFKLAATRSGAIVYTVWVCIIVVLGWIVTIGQTGLC